ncbi:D-serine ammonia-lyase [Pelistega europaea]|uniref:Probable D-serine dehydratase n=1 Tax=Pelistega europaea TaxID=106147 RepID=A0A7Y4LB44_9BURK|nr:D-serine ammonia-lyase [Pelistega europaea]NOL49177.1 D-serine ammonia-lyase [Pelistega europaea]
MDPVTRACVEILSLRFPLVKELQTAKEFCWFNHKIKPSKTVIEQTGITLKQIKDVHLRLVRFAPLLQTLFPDTTPTEGLLESPLTLLPTFQTYLSQHYRLPIEGKLWLKQDNAFPIFGSIKARGGLYEVLVYAEKLALWANLLKSTDDYSVFSSRTFFKFFSQYTIEVASTGNLGIAVGIIGRALGFNVIAHMPSNAKPWKKDKLRELGVKIIEHNKDHTATMTGKPNQYHHIIDSQQSNNLFLGYATAALRLQKQLKEHNIRIDKSHPLFVYLPCGMGISSGGIISGLKTIFGDNVHCILIEPTHSPSMFLGTYTGLYDSITVQDIGLDNHTVADSLACNRSSSFASQLMPSLADGYCTVSDASLFHLLTHLYQQENIFLEPSACAGFRAVIHTLSNIDYLKQIKASASVLKHSTHIVWATGGGMVPNDIRQAYLETGKKYQQLSNRWIG